MPNWLMPLRKRPQERKKLYDTLVSPEAIAKGFIRLDEYKKADYDKTLYVALKSVLDGLSIVAPYLSAGKAPAQALGGGLRAIEESAVKSVQATQGAVARRTAKMALVGLEEVAEGLAEEGITQGSKSAVRN